MSQQKDIPWLRRCSYAAEYALLLTVVGIGGLAPRRPWLRLGEWIGAAAFHLGYYRKVVAANLALVGQWTPEEQQRIRRDLYRTMGRYGMDLLRPDWKRCQVHYEGLDRVRRHAPGGGLALLGHFGNWEILPAVFEREIPKLAMVAKPIKNPYVDAWLRRRREGCGGTVINMRRAVRQAIACLRDGGIVALLVDQYSEEMGRPAMFMGVRTRCIRTIAGLAWKTGCPVLGVHAILQADGSYLVRVQEPPHTDIPPDADSEAAVTAVIESHNQLLERWIREYPEHWFGWFHRRFRDHIDY